jgi:hypothetical protein
VFVAPSVPAAPTTTNPSSTTVGITWIAPAQGSTPITGYSVAIRQSNGLTYSAYSGCTGTAITCTIANSVLQSAPYSLADASIVYAFVLATSLIGSSNYSAAGLGAILPRIPDVPAAPTTTNPSSTTVGVAWVAPVDGGSPITGYSVAIRLSDGVTFAAYSGCTGTALTCTIKNSVLQAGPYSLANGA